MTRHRLPTGGLIDRTRPLHFTFDGQPLTGLAGDTLASALLANGQRLVGRSFKYHRPRGILSAGIEEPNALVELGEGPRRTPNLRATEILLAEGLTARSQNRWPSLRHDLGALIQIGARMLGAGFYYKTFMWPQPTWPRLYERVLRHAAGLGRVPAGADPDLYATRQTHCDLLIVGGGEAGLQAAVEAAETGQRVLLCEQDTLLGGAMNWDTPDRLASLTARLGASPNVTILRRCLVFGRYDHGYALAVQQGDGPARETGWRIRAARTILATGAIERPLVFPGNDRPGVMLASAVRTYIHRFAIRPGDRAVVAVADHAEADATARSLRLAGIEVTAILSNEQAITGTHGGRSLTAVTVDGRRLPCDLICMSGGWTPTAHLFAQTGGRLEFDPRINAFRPADGGAEVVGAAAGSVPRTGPNRHHPGKGKAFVDFQNDVTRADLEQARREGYGNVELTKRYTTLGMGTDQGKTSWANGIEAIAAISGREQAEIGHTTYRPPFAPVTFGALTGPAIGQHLAPTRRTPFHKVFEADGCVFQTSGDWLYARYFPKPGETMAASVEREVRAVRNSVGAVDMSTLGKADIRGPDALEFLERLYCNNLAGLPIGKLRYALMLRADGIVFDDGAVARLGQDHFLVTMTTANSRAAWLWMERLRQVWWPDLDVTLTPVTDHWASLAVAGPNARRVLAALSPGCPTGRDALPFASVRQGTVAGLPARVFSVSFSGEASFEINVPAGHAGHLWRAVRQAGAEFGLTPYGLEALDVLRIEKGHLSVGTEIDGRITPADLGLARMVSTRKNFVGQALLGRPALQSDYRPQLVGLRPKDGTTPIPAAAHLTAAPWTGAPLDSIGRLTASVHSPTLNRPIALAILANGHARHGEALWAVSPVADASVEVIVGPPCAYDPKGERLND